jgi:hypothetical protein
MGRPAYDSYRRLKAFQERMDGKEWVAPTTPLSNPTAPSVRGVEADPLPTNPYYYPFSSEKEYIDALHKENDRLVAQLENAELRAGRMPIGLVWWRLLAGGVGSMLMGYVIKGCAG